MTLQTFSFPFPETRFLKAGSFIYKFQIRGGSCFSGDEVMGGKYLNQELEDIIRTVLGNLDNLKPFSSAHFNVFPYKKRWEGLSKVMCKHSKKKKLKAFPFILILFLEKNTQNGKPAEEKLSAQRETGQHFSSVSQPQSKRSRRESPLGEATLKDFVRDLDDEGQVAMACGLHVDNPHTEGEVTDDPGHVHKQKRTKQLDEPQLKPGVSMIRESGTPHEMHPGMPQEVRVEEVENADSEPARSGILTRLASIFPLSLLFRDH